eukprot:363324-Chlamydomonas_euryale.AAC.9
MQHGIISQPAGLVQALVLDYTLQPSALPPSAHPRQLPHTHPSFSDPSPSFSALQLTLTLNRPLPVCAGRAPQRVPVAAMTAATWPWRLRLQRHAWRPARAAAWRPCCKHTRASLLHVPASSASSTAWWSRRTVWRRRSGVDGVGAMWAMWMACVEKQREGPYEPGVVESAHGVEEAVRCGRCGKSGGAVRAAAWWTRRTAWRKRSGVDIVWAVWARCGRHALKSGGRGRTSRAYVVESARGLGEAPRCGLVGACGCSDLIPNCVSLHFCLLITTYLLATWTLFVPPSDHPAYILKFPRSAEARAESVEARLAAMEDENARQAPIVEQAKWQQRQLQKKLDEALAAAEAAEKVIDGKRMCGVCRVGEQGRMGMPS